MGAPNVEEYVAPNSIIKVSDYSSPKQLAEYLAVLAANPQLYNQYHEWRYEGWTKNLQEMMYFTYHSLPCRVCETVHHLQTQQLSVSNISNKVL